jgi:hypothetical protein
MIFRFQLPFREIHSLLHRTLAPPGGTALQLISYMQCLVAYTLLYQSPAINQPATLA